MTRRQQQVMDLIRRNPLISQKEIAEELGISRSAVAGHVMGLVAKGFLKGRAYVINEEPFVVVVGGANIDISAASTDELTIRDSNPGSINVSFGGVARNIAENLARLGNNCSLIAAVGNDQYGDILLRQSEDAGIDMQHVLRLDAAPTATYVSVLDHSGDVFVAVNDMAIVEHIKPELLYKRENMLREAQAIIVDTNLEPESLLYIAGTCDDQPLFVDTVSVAKAPRILACLDRVHTLKATRLEAGALRGVATPDNKGLPEIAAWLHEQGVARIFITLGKDGVFYSQDGEQGIETTMIPDQGVVNASGAGDAFLAGVVHAWVNDWSHQKTIRFGISAACVALSHEATINPAMSANLVNKIYKGNYG